MQGKWKLSLNLYLDYLRTSYKQCKWNPQWQSTKSSNIPVCVFSMVRDAWFYLSPSHNWWNKEHLRSASWTHMDWSLQFCEGWADLLLCYTLCFQLIFMWVWFIPWGQAMLEIYIIQARVFTSFWHTLIWSVLYRYIVAYIVVLQFPLRNIDGGRQHFTKTLPFVI